MNLPTHVNQNPLMPLSETRKGFEVQSDSSDLIIPRAKLFQGTPSEAEEYPSARGGDIVNTLTKEKLPQVFIPIIRHIEWIRFNARSNKDPNFIEGVEPGAIVWRSSNPQDERVIREGAFGPNGEPPVAPKILSFLSYFPGVAMPLVVSFSKTSYKAGKQLNTMLTFAQGDMWSTKFALSSRLVKGDEYSYYVLDIKAAGKPNQEEIDACTSIYNSFKNVKIVVDVNDEIKPPVGDPTPPPATAEASWE